MEVYFGDLVTVNLALFLTSFLIPPFSITRLNSQRGL